MISKLGELESHLEEIKSFLDNHDLVGEIYYHIEQALNLCGAIEEQDLTYKQEDYILESGLENSRN